MMNPFKQLAKESAIYGISTVLARFINFCFVSCYTRMLSTNDYGAVVDIMAYVAIFQVVMPLGLETGCFYHANKEGYNASKVYSSALSIVTCFSVLVSSALFLFSKSVIGFLEYGDNRLIIYVCGILSFDAITSILFAKLRQTHKAAKFAIIKTFKIIVEVGCNLFLFLVYPKMTSFSLDCVIPNHPNYLYVIFSTFVSCCVCFVILFPDFIKVSVSVDGRTAKSLFIYSIPLMVASLPGIANDVVDRLAFRWFDYSSESWRSTLGIYQAAVKLSVIMSIAVQVFRYSSEPFFFQKAKEENSKQLYAYVMEFFVAFCCVIFTFIISYMDVIALILGREFRGAINVVPIMLFSNIILGMQFNASMWYKLSGKTRYAVLITCTGLAVSIIINVLFMPRYSFWASAFGHLLSYLCMLLFTLALGKNHNPYPYHWNKILPYLLGSIMYYFVVQCMDSWLDYSCYTYKISVHTILFILYCLFVGIAAKNRYSFMCSSILNE